MWYSAGARWQGGDVGLRFPFTVSFPSDSPCQGVKYAYSYVIVDWLILFKHFSRKRNLRGSSWTLWFQSTWIRPSHLLEFWFKIKFCVTNDFCLKTLNILIDFKKSDVTPNHIPSKRAFFSPYILHWEFLEISFFLGAHSLHSGIHKSFSIRTCTPQPWGSTSITFLYLSICIIIFYWISLFILSENSINWFSVSLWFPYVFLLFTLSLIWCCPNLNFF